MLLIDSSISDYVHITQTYEEFVTRLCFGKYYLPLCNRVSFLSKKYLKKPCKKSYYRICTALFLTQTNHADAWFVGIIDLKKHLNFQMDESP